MVLCHYYHTKIKYNDERNAYKKENDIKMFLLKSDTTKTTSLLVA